MKDITEYIDEYEDNYGHTNWGYKVHIQNLN